MKMQPSLVLIFCALVAVESHYLRPCYFTNWGHYKSGPAKYEPESYIPGLCTHIIFAFAKVEWDFTAAASDPADLPSGPQGGYYGRVKKLKEKQPDLKILLSFGGWSAGTTIFKQMASNARTRKKFIDAAIKFIDQYGFDGIDIDWEYPDASDKANYAAFIKELKVSDIILSVFLHNCIALVCSRKKTCCSSSHC